MYKNNWFAIHNHLKTAIDISFIFIIFCFCLKKRKTENSLTFPTYNDFSFSLTIFKLPRLFPHLEENTNFPDFSLTSGHPGYH